MEAQVAVAKLKTSTKGLVGGIIAASALLQIQDVHDLLISLAHNHPHWVSAIGTLCAIAAVLRNPECEKALGICPDEESK